MQKNSPPGSGLFFGSRALSTFGDEVWEIALPIYFALAGFAVEQVGVYYSLYSLGTVLGFLLLPWLARHHRPGLITIWVDAFQLLIFAIIGVSVFSGASPGLLFFEISGFLLAGATAIWFGSSETLIAEVLNKSSSQSFHRLNYLSSTVGPVVAPFVGAILFSWTGLSILALFNALTFLPQIIAVSRMDKKPKESRPVNASANEWASENQFSLRTLLLHPFYGPLLGVTSSVKISLLGVLPFIPFLFTKENLGVFSLAVVLAAFPLGSFLGALSYKKLSIEKLASVFLTDTIAMFVAAAIIIVCLKFQWIWAVPIAAFAGGLFCARYTIQIRAMRLIITPSNQLPKLVSLQGLFSRVVTPLAGLLFGSVFALAAPPLLSFLVGVLIVLIGSIFATFAAGGFRKVIDQNKSHANQAP
jgi:MFS family permease